MVRLDRAGRFARTNHAGHPVTLLEGPAVAAAALACAATVPGPPRLRAAAALATGAGAVLGAWDDVAGSADARGLRGHLGALRRGEVTTGALKVVGLGAAGLTAGALVRRDPLDALLAGGVVAGAANLVNLLDLRPGRAGKAVLLLCAPALARPGAAGDLLAGPVGATAALLVPDLRARSMLGDCGANALGALVGVGIAAATSRPVLAAHLAGIAALTVASERVSFTAVIERTPGLRELDGLGRAAR
ncbi:hypothetical protein D5H78_16995 [Vallicoccus soli]|uniref:Uncharacterized protein n=1 Tax=Vallicoccus soli TaxID=2339232 RepID=A0A3A3ZDR4_9ACTN|nr:hypothetical protein D5H78_16995 [Vallicoccus soli]